MSDKSNKVGRPPFEIDEKMLKKVKSLASRGLTQQQIADSIGIRVSTLCKYKNKNKEFMEAIKEGKALGISEIANSLFVNAKSGNVTAQIFFLKNQGDWSDKQEVEHSGDALVNNVNITFKN